MNGKQRQDRIGRYRESVGVYLGLHQVPQRRPAVTPQPMRHAVGLWQGAEQVGVFLLFVFGQQPPGHVSWTQGFGVQLCGSARLKWRRGHQGRGLGKPVCKRFSLVLTGFRVASHTFIVAERLARQGRRHLTACDGLSNSVLGTRNTCEENTCQNAEFLQLSSAPLLFGQKRSFRSNRNADLG